ncbi:hypothetical protein NLU13_7119 [Sarocladium strictum]|uniref:Myb-like domain-containing protein n=1 Tax=Sarocladium strictum TaxID=5046 RepID=A0AA39GG94_SARSR|nr:hypothetical protein NLU13_7119 [Sarocladium strictum]
MSPIRPSPFPGMYTPTADVVDRHEYGVVKNRKPASTGGGRAWSEEEESYLLQTRMQKMPYKHIAAHLRKTELACRLHYHQLSHGSGRRKRTASCSSGGSSEHSPVMSMAPMDRSRELQARSLSPPSTSSGYVHVSGNMQLPSIMGANTPPRLPAILPKPMAMTNMAPAHGHNGQMMHAPPPAEMQHSGLQPSAMHRTHSMPPAPALRLDCDTASSMHSAPNHTANHVDLARLHSVYSAHRNTFWSVVAKDYGHNASPAVLEQAWKTGLCCPQSRAGSPITPGASPASDEKNAYSRIQDKTRIASILSLDVEPRSA